MKKCIFFLLFAVTSFVKIPSANTAVLEYVDGVLGKQVGTGECADLVFNAQFYVKKKGIKSSSKSKKVLPGDYIYFNQAKFSNGLSFLKHSAIVYEVKTQEHLVIAHQNHNGDKTVQLLEIDLNQLGSGSVNTNHP